MPVRTRFAPSPTGYLHIGGVRTALFNWLFARKHGGQFLLRIDDTDQQRNVEEALRPDPARLPLAGHRLGRGPGGRRPTGPLLPVAARRAVPGGGRAAARRGRRLPRLRHAGGDCRPSARRPRPTKRSVHLQPPLDGRDRRRAGRASRPRAAQGVVRLKMPREGKLVLDDLIRGEVEFDWAREQDHVIQRADGSCLYHLATVVDDHEMQITHVIRAEEHLSNTPRQVFIAQSLGYEPPAVRPPAVRRRAGQQEQAQQAEARQVPEEPRLRRAQRARPARSPSGSAWQTDRRDVQPGDRRFLRAGRLPARRDPQLPAAARLVAGRHDRGLHARGDDRALLARTGQQGAGQLRPAEAARRSRTGRCSSCRSSRRRPAASTSCSGPGCVDRPAPVRRGAATSRAIVEAAGDRIKMAGDILEYAEFFVADDALAYDAKAFEKRITKPADAAPLLTKFKDQLAQVEPFEPDALEHALKAFVETEGIQIGQIIHALRVAVTGKAVGFGVYETLAILGKQRCLKRIERALRTTAHGAA